MRINFILPGKPVAQGRPRFYRKGNFVVATDPKPSKVYKADIAYIAQKAREEAGLEGMFEGPLGMQILAYFPCPKSKWRVKTPRPEEHHSKRPDADNIAKSVKDGLSGVLYHDDGQISELIIRKRIIQPHYNIATRQCNIQMLQMQNILHHQSVVLYLLITF